MDDLNRQAQVWLDTVANVRVHGTTWERPVDRLVVERGRLRPLPDLKRLRPWLGEQRRVGRDGYVHWDRAWYGLPWPWRPGQEVQVQPGDGIVELWVGDERVAVHPRATRPGQRFPHPRQWAGMPARDTRPRPEPRAVQLPQVEVEQRPLGVYQALAEAVSRP